MGNVFFGGGKVGMKAPSAGRLPSGYTELACIQSGGTQYINTGYAPAYNSRVIVDVSDLTTEDFVFGARDSASSTAANQFGVYITSTSKVRTDYFGTNVSGTPSSINGRTTIDKNANITTAFGLTLENTAKSSRQVSHSMYLFALNNAGTLTAPASMKLYSCQVYDNGELVRDFVPCMSDADGVGLYDLVEGKFYGNAGTGGFIGGEEVA